MTQTEREVVRWINKQPFIKTLGVEVYREKNTTGIRAKDKVKGAKDDERLFDVIFGIVRGAIEFTEFKRRGFKNIKRKE